MFMFLLLHVCFHLEVAACLYFFFLACVFEATFLHVREVRSCEEGPKLASWKVGSKHLKRYVVVFLNGKTW